jgi:cytochrome c oxidase cbb3-type subunit 3
MNVFWSWFVGIVSIVSILSCWWLIRWTSQQNPGDVKEGEVSHHTWDNGELSEYNNPLPRWWLWMFYISIIFGLVYLILYPGLGNYQGVLGWTQERQYATEIHEADERYGPIFAQFAGTELSELAKNPEALKVGQRLFATYCSQCHGSDARGAPGYPNLTDNDWLYGDEPQTIKETILNGRNGMMPALGAAIGDAQAVDDLATYVLSLSVARLVTANPAAQSKFQTVCGACHTPTGQGNPALGAPNLTDNIWLYGGSRGAIKKAIVEGRQGHMPAHKDFLGEDKVHVLAAYVYSLSN